MRRMTAARKVENGVTVVTDLDSLMQ